MQKHLFARINLPGSHIHFLNGGARDHDAECDEIRKRNSRAWRDRSPASRASARTRTSDSTSRRAHCTPAATRRRLALATRRANASLFGGRLDRVPREALTMGIGTMLDARAIVLIATGREKARAIGSMFEGLISTERPASVLQLHPNRRSDSGFTGRREASAAGVPPAAVTTPVARVAPVCCMRMAAFTFHCACCSSASAAS